ncbi:MAG: hypothetical protein ACJ8LG_10020, partial [Massilia sp.]
RQFHRLRRYLSTELLEKRALTLVWKKFRRQSLADSTKFPRKRALTPVLGKPCCQTKNENGCRRLKRTCTAVFL